MSEEIEGRDGGRSVVVVIDGPSGSGKSSVSRAVARELGFAYLDTGAMYRALTWWCLDQGVDLDDEPAVTAAARALPLHIDTDPSNPAVLVGGTDVTAAIRESRISGVVSQVACHRPTRAVLIEQQRRCIDDHRTSGIVAEGRDLTTVVAPDADLRLLLSASEAARLARRARELHGGDDDDAVSATRDEVVRRDAQDSAVASFLEPTDGVTELDTSDLTFEITVETVLDLVGRVRRSAPEPAAEDGTRGSGRRAAPHTGE